MGLVSHYVGNLCPLLPVIHPPLPQSGAFHICPPSLQFAKAAMAEEYIRGRFCPPILIALIFGYFKIH